MQQLFCFMLHGRVCLQEGEARGEIAEVLAGPSTSPPKSMEMFFQKCQEKTPEPHCEAGARGRYMQVGRSSEVAVARLHFSHA